jgi:hypothetical protein
MASLRTLQANLSPNELTRIFSVTPTWAFSAKNIQATDQNSIENHSRFILMDKQYRYTLKKNGNILGLKDVFEEREPIAGILNPNVSSKLGKTYAGRARIFFLLTQWYCFKVQTLHSTSRSWQEKPFKIQNSKQKK